MGCWAAISMVNGWDLGLRGGVNDPMTSYMRISGKCGGKYRLMGIVYLNEVFYLFL